MSLKRIVFDVSTLLEWNRPPVGIVRTQLELAKWLVSGGVSVPYLFVAFYESRHSLVIVPKARVIEMLNHLDSGTSGMSGSSGLSCNNVRQIIKKSVAGMLPPRIKEKAKRASKVYRRDGLKVFFKKFARKGALKLLPKFNVSWSILNSSAGGDLSVEIPVMIRNAMQEPDFLGRNDVYVSVGLDWDHSNYEYLYWAKKQRHFEFVGIFYDGIPIQYPQYVRSKFFPALFFRHYYFLSHLSDRIACISNYSRDEFRNISSEYAVDCLPDLKTIYLGEKILETSAPTRAVPEKFVLYVSTIESRKNHILLLNCWKKAIAENRALPDLVFVGMWGWGIEEIQEVLDQSPELKSRLHIFNDVGDEELASMYQKAYLSVFPSFVEGWGLGAAESLAYGTPCLVSDAAALKEATRDLMPSLPPSDVDAWLDALDLYANDPDAYRALKEKAVQGFVLKTWSEFSDEFYQYALGGTC